MTSTAVNIEIWVQTYRKVGKINEPAGFQLQTEISDRLFVEKTPDEAYNACLSFIGVGRGVYTGPKRDEYVEVELNRELIHPDFTYQLKPGDRLKITVERGE